MVTTVRVNKYILKFGEYYGKNLESIWMANKQYLRDLVKKDFIAPEVHNAIEKFLKVVDLEQK